MQNTDEDDGEESKNNLDLLKAWLDFRRITPITKALGLCYFMEFNGVVDAGVCGSFALRERESELPRFISSQNVFSYSSRSISVKRTTFGVPLGSPKHSV
jgi:hypothetical protein